MALAMSYKHGAPKSQEARGIIKHCTVNCGHQGAFLLDQVVNRMYIYYGFEASIHCILSAEFWAEKFAWVLYRVVLLE